MDIIPYTIVPDAIFSDNLVELGTFLAVAIVAKKCKTNAEIAETLTNLGIFIKPESVAIYVAQLRNPAMLGKAISVKPKPPIYKNIEEIYRDFPDNERQELVPIVGRLLKWYAKNNQPLTKAKVKEQVNKVLFNGWIKRESTSDALANVCVICNGSGEIKQYEGAETIILPCICKG